MRTFALTVALLAVAGLARADDVDPEPPGGGPFGKLQGKWQSVRRIVKGRESESAQASYEFKNDKVTYTLGKGRPRTMTLKADKKRSDLFSMAEENARFNSGRYYFKIENGELYLVPAVWAKSDDKIDFSGKTAPVTIFKRTK
jgi:hypothetical protein